MTAPHKSEEQPPSSAVADTVDHLFRREAGRLVSIVTRQIGVQNLHLAEDVVQDALLRAMQTWPFTGVPENPAAWILQTARHRALDQIRRHSRWLNKQADLAFIVEGSLVDALSTLSPKFEDEISDSQLRMMFVCCHPGLSVEAQVALVLKVLCGFGEGEIASAFLSNKTTVAQRLVRARQFFCEQQLSMELPIPDELPLRFSAVLQALYLLFNEGYKASHGDSLLREELCAEAIRLGELLSVSFQTNKTLHALLALMYFNAARLPARVDSGGGILLLAVQDRTLWDRDKIRRGFAHFAASTGGLEVTCFHLESGIAACHSLAASDAVTDWKQILQLYDQLLAKDPSPIVALNRTVALAKVQGPAAGLHALSTISNRCAVEAYVPFHAVAGQLWMECCEPTKAAVSIRRALELASLDVERNFLMQRLADAEIAIRRQPRQAPQVSPGDERHP